MKLLIRLNVMRWIGTSAFREAQRQLLYGVFEQRFDPRTGEYTELGTREGQGSVELNPPDNRDYVFLLTTKGTQ